MTKTLAFAAAIALTTATAGAAAQDGSAPDVTFEFGDEDVLGTTVSPDGDRVLVPPRGRRVTLVRPRLHFVPEMMKSVENL